jgi:hypothetical protein
LEKNASFVVENCGKVAENCDHNSDPWLQFATTMRNMQRDSVRGMWDSEWLPNVSGKQVTWHAVNVFVFSNIFAGIIGKKKLAVLAQNYCFMRRKICNIQEKRHFL